MCCRYFLALPRVCGVPLASSHHSSFLHTQSEFDNVVVTSRHLYQITPLIEPYPPLHAPAQNSSSSSSDLLVDLTAPCHLTNRVTIATLSRDLNMASLDEYEKELQQLKKKGLQWLNYLPISLNVVFKCLFTLQSGVSRHGGVRERTSQSITNALVNRVKDITEYTLLSNSDVTSKFIEEEVYRFY